MKALLFFKQRHVLFKIVITTLVLINLIAPFHPMTTLAAGNKCKTSGPASAAYTVQVCITSPADGATVSGSKTIKASVTVTGTDPGTSKLIFYLAGDYLITDYQTTYTFVLPTTKFVDGSRLLEVEAVMRDGFTSQRASITLNFSNGIVTPPVNTKTFTIRKGTTPPAGQAFVLAAAGDGADGATFAGNVTDLIASWNPNLFLYLGDVYDDGTSTEFRNWYGTSTTFFGRFRSITNPTIGNHEYMSGAKAPGYFDYWDNVPTYYSFDAAGWHIISLDSNCGLIGGCSQTTAQYQWLQNDLAAHKNICTIAYYHHPQYNVGPEGPAAGMGPIWSLLAQSGVDIVLNGHDHNYQRWKPLDGNGAVSATGITQFVAAAGGHGTQQFITTDSRLAVGFDTTPTAFGALRLQLNPQGAGYQYINTAGTMLDSGSVRCSGAPADTTAPSKPTNLAASTSSPQLVSLTWTASTDNVGVTGYSIYRDGALLVNIGPTTSYDDTTVQAGTSYSYQIRARDAAGNVSSLSSAATATTGLLLFSDGFESGNLSQWTGVSGLTVQQQEVFAGLYAARGTSTGTATYAYEQLAQTQNNLYYRLWFKIVSQGANSIYLQRFRTSTNGAILGVFVSSTGKLAYRNDVSAVTTTSTTSVSPGAWHELQVHVQINGAAGATEIWLDGIRISSLSKTENLGTTPIGRVQLGDSSTGRTYDIALDRVALSTQFIDSANPPEGGVSFPTSTTLPASPVSSTNTPTATATLTSTPTNTPISTPTRTSTPTGTFTPTSGALGAGIYDDFDAAWTYSGTWQTFSGSGPYNNTLHQNNVTGNYAEVNFNGVQVTLTYLRAPSRGSIDVYIDGTKVATLNANNSSIVWQSTWTSSTLSAGTHTIRFVNAGGGWIDIDAVRISGVPTPTSPPPVVNTGTYDDFHSAWVYSGTWQTFSGSGPYNNTLHQNNVTGNYAELNFMGTQAKLIYLRAPSRGSIDVYIDGTKVATLNANNSSIVWQSAWTSPTLSAGTHTIRFVNAGGGWIDIDAVQIL